MTDLRLINIKLRFEFSELNDRIMNVDIKAGGTELRLAPDRAGFYDIDLDMLLPQRLLMCFSGKDNRVDTLLDQEGRIVADLFVRLDQIVLDNVPVKIDTNKLLVVETESGEKHRTHYVGFNGHAVLDFAETNVFDQIMVWNRQCNHDAVDHQIKSL